MGEAVRRRARYGLREFCVTISQAASAEPLRDFEIHLILSEPVLREPPRGRAMSASPKAGQWQMK